MIPKQEIEDPINKSVASIICDRDGVQPETFVCQHIAQSLQTNERVGFFWSGEDASPWPDAWCTACEERVQQVGGEWKGEALKNLEAKILCAKCYERTKRLNLGWLRHYLNF